MINSTINKLRCEYLLNPLGIDEAKPRLSWQLQSDRRGARQLAYRLRVATTQTRLERGNADLWDSGLVQSQQSTHVEYGGKKLLSRMHCFWKVDVYDDQEQCLTSEINFWTMGLLEQSDWQAEWITANPHIFTQDPQAFAPSLTEAGSVCYFRRDFSLAQKVVSATLYASARGIFELTINGKRVGSDLFAPEWTDYHKRIHYRSYDVTHLLNRNKNCIAASLGDGWWSGYVGWQEQRGRYNSLENSVLLQCEIELVNGSHLTLSSGTDWTCNTGPILFSDFMMGELYDARREHEAWDTPNFTEDAAWLPVKLAKPPTAHLVAQLSEPVRIVDELAPVSFTEVKPQIFIVDLGQNITGWARMTLPQLPAGTQITLRYGERLDAQGNLYTENLRRAKATDTYITQGKPSEHYQPHFTFHGFQYIELRGLPAHTDMAKVEILGCVIHSATPPAGQFECSHAGVNQIWSNAYWSQKDNFLSVPTDCPQRDERLGWTGDAQVFMRTATYNMDVAAFFSKWMRDISDAQTEEGVFPDTAPRLREDCNFVGLGNLGGGAGWADAGITIPYQLWKIYGDRRVLQQHYSAMVRWLNWIEENNPKGLRTNKLGNNYGDWLCIPSDTSFGTHSPMKSLLATAFWADGCNKLSEIATALNYSEDAQRFSLLFNKVREAFQNEWLLKDGELSVNTQTAYLLALTFNLLPNDKRERAAEKLVDNIQQQDWHLNTGFIGVGLLNPQLSLAGKNAVAYKLLLQESYPAWLYPVLHGATTIWERWNGWTEKDGFFNPHMNSFNHYSLGSVSEWLYRYIAGIELNPDKPGFQDFVLCPYIDSSLSYAKASYQTMFGQIESHWQYKQQTIQWDIRIPANSSARVGIPHDTIDSIAIDNAPASTFPSDASFNKGRTWLDLSAGRYRISWPCSMLVEE
ncbi:alpha-L-rhamnosidase [Alteromonadaceae bacterium Bs31]|nr:alpha-L-rhamnosidase [Alteromonadaceae bacterium Bs31]